MLIIGCDFHTRYQQIAVVDNATALQPGTTMCGRPSESGGRVDRPLKSAEPFGVGYAFRRKAWVTL